LLAPDAKSTTAVSAKGLGLTFQTRQGPVHALSNVDLDIGKGEFVSFIGPSGCGKTTFLRVIADLEPPTSGTISVNSMTPEEARKLRAYGYVFQAPALYPWRTVERNIALPLEIMGVSKEERRERIARLLDLVDLAGFDSATWSWSASRASRRSSPGSFRAACSSALPSPAPSSSMPTCC
jgi:NitT/TauT family transport system ATP-binding protein